MNKQNFEAKDRFPLSTQALGFMQEMVFASARLALIGGNRYILSGCETVGNTVNPGTLVVDGEIMPFDGGAKGATITVVETPVSVSANGLTFENARITRKAIFATGTGPNYLPWADFLTLKTNRQLEEAKATVKYVDDEIAKIQAGSIPKGVIVMWSGAENKIPSGWALCNGMIPMGQEKATPNLLGRFIVGYNPDNPDYNESGKTGGAAAVALTPEQMAVHNHMYDNFYYAEGGIPTSATLGTGVSRISTGDSKTVGVNAGWDNKTDDFFSKIWSTKDSGGNEAHENRPPYYVLAFIIKL